MSAEVKFGIFIDKTNSFMYNLTVSAKTNEDRENIKADGGIARLNL